MTGREFIETLDKENLLGEEGRETLESWILVEHTRVKLPWYISALTGIGAWFSAQFMLGFVFLLAEAFHEPGYLFLGAACLAAGILISKASEHIFLTQVSLVFMLAGHSLILVGTSSLSKDPGILVLTALALVVIANLLRTNGIYQFLSVLAFNALALVWIIDIKQPDLVHLLVLVEFATLAYMILGKKWSGRIRFIGLAMAFSLAVTLGAVLLTGTILSEYAVRPWPSNLIITLGTLYLLWNSRETEDAWKGEPLWTAIVSVLILSFLSAPGIICALSFIVLGFSRSMRGLLGMGLVMFPFFVWRFYYSFQFDLLEKSLVISGSGVFLLVLSWYLNRRPWAKIK